MAGIVLFVNTSTGASFSITVDPDATVGDVHRALTKEQGILSSTLASAVLRCGAVELANSSDALADLGVCPESVLDLSFGVAFAAPPAIAAGHSHSLGVTQDGKIVVWGSKAQSSSAPADSERDYIGVAVGMRHYAALHEEGYVTIWRDGSSGWRFTKHWPGRLAVTVSAGCNFTVVVLDDGSLRSVCSRSPPVAGTVGGDDLPTPDLGELKALNAVCGDRHAIALLEDGTVREWLVGGGAVPPRPELAGRRVVGVAAGGTNSIALLAGGEIICWGLEGPPADGLDRIPDCRGRQAVSIACGRYHALAVLEDGTAVGWGDNDNGRAKPPPSCIGRCREVAAGLSHSLAVLDDGSVVGWGYGGVGQLAVPPGQRVRAVRRRFA
eukprot:TRINITY_DN65473_c0_g1_i1.p1 TRINITY_DN65473_c0_g1~~TRINITY_DN65473_c0_g1_i1.p1  ORF type:complete len:407 (+),score=111.78 TRINITY_DN65473_c0_g1_i1:76-1221(+)